MEEGYSRAKPELILKYGWPEKVFYAPNDSVRGIFVMVLYEWIGVTKTRRTQPGQVQDEPIWVGLAVNCTGCRNLVADSAPG
jgi:hypothetical protein